MDELAAFLIACMSEDERRARRLHDEDCATTPPYHSCDCGRPAREYREVAAKRNIVRRCSGVMNEMDVYPNGLVSPRALLARQMLVHLGAVYADRPGYRSEWRP